MEDQYMTELKSIENSTKYKILVNYLKLQISKEAYVSSVEIQKILEALEEIK